MRIVLKLSILLTMIAALIGSPALAQISQDAVSSSSGGGSPGGSSGQQQYNNSGAFGGFTQSGDCTTVTSTGVTTCPFSFFKSYIAGHYYLPFGGIIGNSLTAGAANRIYFIPLMVPQTCTISELFLRVTTGSAGNWQAGIYASDGTTLLPTGTVLAKSNASGSTTTGSTDVTTALNANLQLVKGALYWLGVNVDNASATFPVANPGGSLLMYANVVGDSTMSNVIGGGTSPGYAIFNSQTLGTWPDMTSLSFTPSPGASVPAVGFRVVSVP